jgi:hypothetical protein
MIEAMRRSRYSQKIKAQSLPDNRGRLELSAARYSVGGKGWRFQLSAAHAIERCPDLPL